MIIFYSIVLIASLGGIMYIVKRNSAEFAEFNFADFMEGALSETAGIWRANFHESFFMFLEKRLRGIRIMFLKMEQILFRLLHRVRGIKEKNGNGVNNHTDLN